MNDDGIEKTLEMFNNNLNFDSENHKYYYNGEEQESITNLLKPYFPFDANAVAGKLSESDHPTYGGMSKDDIFKMWGDKRDKGTHIHEFVENYLNGEFVTFTYPEEIRIYEYLRRFSFDKIINEVKVVAPEWRLAGTIDCLVKKDGKWYIIDWKTDNRVYTSAFVEPKVKRKKANETEDERAERINEYKKENGQKCTGILGWFDNCNFNKYTMQINIYRIILETVYDIKIHGMKVVHIKDDKITDYEIPDMREYAGMVIKQSLKE